MRERLELRAERDGLRVTLRAPEVGVYTSGLERGAIVTPGTIVGVLTQLGVRRALVVPAGVEGRVATEAPERRHHPLGFGDVVLEIEEVRGTGSTASAATAAAATAAAATAAAATAAAATATPGGLVVRATTSGRFWHKPAPSEPAFVAVGAVIREGSPIGLLEVMKTFGHVTYRAAGGLPAEARVLVVLAADGADVRRGDPLLAIEAAR